VLPAHLAAELQSGVPAAMVLGWYLSNCFEALLGAVAIRVVRPQGVRLDSFSDAIVFLLCGALLAPLLSSFLDALLITQIGWGNSGYWQLVGVRTTSNVLAALIVVPLIVTWAHGGRQALRAPRKRYLEAGLLFSGMLAAGLVIFNAPDLGARYGPALLYVPLPFMLWAAVRLGPMGSGTANLVLAAAAIWGALNGLGPFVGNSPEVDAQSVQLFLIAATVPLLLLAALLAERQRVEREAHQQRQQLAHLSRVAMLGGLSGALAHELSQPLTAILSNAQAAQCMVRSGRMEMHELDDILRDIVASNRRADEVIRRLGALFLNGEVQAQSLAANALVREVLDLAHGDLATRHVEVVVQPGQHLPRIRGDTIQLQQVLLNLVLNACEAMSAGASSRRRLTVQTRASAEGRMLISLYDLGTGFPPGDCEKLFEPFYTTKPNGMGLGLAISRSIISSHGGKLWAEALPKGAAFHVELPAEIAAAAHARRHWPFA
jgi:signal transduction histidine kinase